MKYAIMLLSLALATPAAAQDMSNFTMGPVFEEFGPVADVEADMDLPDNAYFRVAFDAAKGAEDGKLNSTLNGAARFINMHVRAGVPEERIDVAVVVHGGAVLDLLRAEPYAAGKDGAENANAPLVAALVEHGVRIIVCGQSATAQGVANADLLPGVEVALSAMTAHALLQQQGYTVNPF